MKDKILNFFKNLSKLEWVTAGFLSGAVWMFIGLLIVLLTAIPEAGAIILLIGGGMVLLAIPLIFVCSMRRSLRRIAQSETEQQPKEDAPIPEPSPEPIAEPTPAPVPETTVGIPAVPSRPHPPTPSSYIYLLDELEMRNHTSRTEADLKGQSGMTVVMARDKEGYALQMVRVLAGSVETERFHLPADYFQTNTKNDFRIRLFEQGIFRVDVDLLWEDPAFCAMVGI